jgi:7-cyano-7-deazaguanine synthase in queuosine biosynthesis
VSVGPWRSPAGIEFRMSAPHAYRIDQARIAHTFRAQLPDRVADLLEIAMAVHAIDRLTPRSLRDPIGRGWCRELAPVIGVRDVDFWSSQVTSQQLTRLLDWLTDDFWTPMFSDREGARPPEEVQGTLFTLTPEREAAVACFSGGLDSFAGAAIDLDRSEDVELVLMGQSGTSRARKLQRELAGALAARTARVQPLLIKANLVAAKGQPQDRQQRTRGFLFLAMAAATALVADVGEVRMYENGIGAINLPYSHGQIGAHMSRSAHPKTLLEMQRLVALMDVGQLRVSLPHMFDTKAQMIAAVPARFADLISATISCDTWSSDRQPAPLNGARAHRCGRCSSCVLRRQALRASGQREIDACEAHRTDVFDRAARDDDHFALHVMLSQVAELTAATADDRPWAHLINTYPQLIEARDALRELGEGDRVEQRLVSLYRSYAKEWEGIDAPRVDEYLRGVHA